MALEISDEDFSFGNGDQKFIRFDSFPALILSHREHCKSTMNVEEDGRALYQRLLEGSSTDAEVEKFVTDVCVWGGDDGTVLDQIIGGQTWSDVHNYFKRAVARLARTDLDQDQRDILVAQALTEMTQTTGLGYSYGSKMLRMLRADLCGVLDSRVRDQVGYEDSPEGFALYSEQLSQVALRLDELDIANPSSEVSRWSVGDVDAVVFAVLKGWAIQ